MCLNDRQKNRAHDFFQLSDKIQDCEGNCHKIRKCFRRSTEIGRIQRTMSKKIEDWLAGRHGHARLTWNKAWLPQRTSPSKWTPQDDIPERTRVSCRLGLSIIQKKATWVRSVANQRKTIYAVFANTLTATSYAVLAILWHQLSQNVKKEANGIAHMTWYSFEVRPMWNEETLQYEIWPKGLALGEQFKGGVFLDLLFDGVETDCNHMFCKECVKDLDACLMCRHVFAKRPRFLGEANVTVRSSVCLRFIITVCILVSSESPCWVVLTRSHCSSMLHALRAPILHWMPPNSIFRMIAFPWLILSTTGQCWSEI